MPARGVRETVSTLALPDAQRLPSGWPKKEMSPWQKWGLILLAPYVVVFLVFVLYPVGYGL
jgi:multiple sugar transport system permease protein